MDEQERKTARRRTTLVLLIAYIAFLLGGYATRFGWSNGQWAATVIAGSALALALYLLIRDLWKLAVAVEK
jgi:hypothetical protein